MKKISVSDFIWQESPVNQSQPMTANTYDDDPVINPYNPLEIYEVYITAKRYDSSYYVSSPYFSSPYFTSPYFPPLEFPSSYYYSYYYPYYYSKPYDFELPYLNETYSAYTNADPDPDPKPTNPDPNPDPKPQPTPKPDWGKLSDSAKIGTYLLALRDAAAKQDYLEFRKVVDNFPSAVPSQIIPLKGRINIDGTVMYVELYIMVDSNCPKVETMLVDRGPMNDGRMDWYQIHTYNGPGQTPGYAAVDIRVEKQHVPLFEQYFPIKPESHDN